MSSNNLPRITMGFTPYGILQHQRDDPSQPSSISVLIDEAKNDHTKVRHLTGTMHKYNSDMKGLYEHIADIDKWQELHQCYSTAYRIETDHAMLTVKIHDVPRDFQVPFETQAYINLEFYSKRTDITSLFGITMYTTEEGFTNETFGKYLIDFVKYLMVEMANEDDTFRQIEHYIENQIEKKLEDKLNKFLKKAQEKFEAKVAELVEKGLGFAVPEWAWEGIDFAMNPSVNSAIDIAEDTVIAVMPTVVGKVLAYAAFELINYIFEDDYRIRYAIVNRTGCGFIMSEAYKEYVGGQTPAALKPNSHQNILYPLMSAYLYRSLGDTDPEERSVMQFPTFMIGNNGGGCPSAMVKLTNTTENEYSSKYIMCAYDIVWGSDNKMGMGIYDDDYANQYSDTDVYKALTHHKHYSCDASGDRFTVKQVTNALSGVDNEIYDVLVVIDQN